MQIFTYIHTHIFIYLCRDLACEAALGLTRIGAAERDAAGDAQQGAQGVVSGDFRYRRTLKWLDTLDLSDHVARVVEN